MPMSLILGPKERLTPLRDVEEDSPPQKKPRVISNVKVKVDDDFVSRTRWENAARRQMEENRCVRYHDFLAESYEAELHVIELSEEEKTVFV